MRTVFLLALLAAIAACTTVTATPNGPRPERERPPDSGGYGVMNN